MTFSYKNDSSNYGCLSKTRQTTAGCRLRRRGVSLAPPTRTHTQLENYVKSLGLP